MLLMGNFGSRERLKRNKILLVLLLMISSAHQSLRRRTSYRRIIQKNDNKIHQDGIIILKHDQVNLADGAWTTIVTATKPTLIGLESWLENITQTLNIEETNWPVGMLKAWKIRIQRLRDRVTINEERVTQPQLRRTRTRRSPFGFVGSAGHYLFGFAEQKSLDILNDHVEQARETQSIIFHNQKSLISVVNKSREAIEILATNFNNITSLALQKLRLLEEAVDRDHQTAHHKVRYITASLIINEDIVRMESMVDRYMEELTHYKFVRANLERGRLNRIILDESELQEIFTQMNTESMEPPPATWLYKNSKIQLVKDDDSTLTYAILIPSVTDAYYRKYEFVNFHVPLNNTNYEFMKTINVKKFLAIEFTGVTSLPLDKNCYGQRPIICISPVIHKGNTCEVDLVLDHPTPSCEMKILKRPIDKTVDIVEFQRDQVIVSPLIEDLEVITTCKQCNGYKSKFFRDMKNDIYIQDIQECCTYDIGNFIIKGLKSTHSNFYEVPTQFKIRERINLDLDSDMTKEAMSYVSEMKELNVKIPQLHVAGNDLPKLPWRKDTSKNDVYTATIGVALAVATAVMLAYAAYAIYKKTWSSVSKPTYVSGVVSHDVVPSTPSAPPESPQNVSYDGNKVAGITNIYPVLEVPKTFNFSASKMVSTSTNTDLDVAVE